MLDQSHENGMKFQTLEIEEQVRGPFKVCRTRAATCEVTMSIADILILQFHTLQETKKTGQGLGMRLGHDRAEPSGLAEVGQLYVELNSECSLQLHISDPHSKSQYTHQPYARHHAHMCHES